MIELELPIKVNNQKIANKLISPPEDRKHPGLLLVHGWGSNQSRYVELGRELTNLGFVCLTIDLRGHGKSDGILSKLSRENHLDDILESHNALISQRNVDKKKIGIIASSYGAYLATLASPILYAERHPLRWLVLRAPALATDDSFEEPTLKLLREGIVTDPDKCNFDSCYALGAISQFDGKLLIVESESDEIIPHVAIEKYSHLADPRNLTYRVIKDARHELTEEQWNGEFSHIIYGWLQSHLG